MNEARKMARNTMETIENLTMKWVSKSNNDIQALEDEVEHYFKK